MIRTNVILTILIALAAIWPAVAAFSATIDLTVDGASEYVVVLSSDASPSEKWAATELVNHIGAISGAKLPVRTAAETVPAKAILIGDGDAVRSLGVAIDAAALGTDGFVIRTVGDRLVIAGGRKRGTLYGVYTLLERLGVRWWSPTETMVPTMSTIVLDGMDIRQVPKLEYRDMMYGDMFSEEGRLWAARNKVNGMAWQNEAPEKLGGRYEFVGNLVHSYMGLLAASGVEVTDDMLALNDRGQRAGTQPCLTHPKVLEAMVKAVIDKYRANPNARFVVVGQNDNRGYCRCDRCQAIAEREQSQAGPVIVFANQVAEAVEREIPGARITTAAYQWSRKPPAHVKPRPNVNVTLCSIECDFAHPFAAGTTEVNKAFRDDIIGWSKITSKVYIWDYTTNFRHYLAPHPNLDVLTANVKFFADHGAAGVFEQGAHTCAASEFAALRMWVLARSLWSPDADATALLEEFLTGFYGPAAPAIRRYIDIMHAAGRKDDFVMRCFTMLDAPYLAPATIAAAHVALRKAEQAVADNEVYARRVRHAHMPIWYVLLKSGPGSRTWRTTEAGVGPMTFADLAGRFTGVVGEWKVNSIAERNPIGPWLQWLAHYAKLTASGESPVPPELKDAPAGAYRLIQAAQTGGMNKWLEPQAGASDGWAIQCPTNAWLVRHAFSDHNDFVPGKTYRLFVRVRGAVEPDADGRAWACGIRSSGRDKTLRVAARQMTDDRWHTYEVGQWTPRRGDYFWFAVQDTAVLKVAYLDCLWLVEAD